MPKTTLEDWTFTRQAWASQALLRVGYFGDEVNGQAVFRKGLWSDIITHVMTEATHMCWVARAAGFLRNNGIPITPTEPLMAKVLTDPTFIAEKIIGDPTCRELAGDPADTALTDPYREMINVWEPLNIGDAGLLYYAAEACCIKIYRTALRTRLPPIDVWPEMPGGEGEGMGMAPIVVGALVLAAIAATAAIAWVQSEASEDAAQVQIETARATAESTTAMEIAKAQIANGQPVSLPPRLLNWGKRQKTVTSSWFRTAAVVGIVGVGAGAGYLGYELGGKS